MKIRAVIYEYLVFQFKARGGSLTVEESSLFGSYVTIERRGGNLPRKCGVCRAVEGARRTLYLLGRFPEEDIPR